MNRTDMGDEQQMTGVREPSESYPSDPSSSGTGPVSPDPESLTLGDFFTIKRGVETGDNDFFLLTPAEVLDYELPLQFLRPILPGPQHLPDDEVIADPEGHPILGGKLFLLDCPLPERDIRSEFPKLWSYLERGVELGVPERYICRHRSPWYVQERRPPSQFLCAYMGQSWDEEGPPFRFILNHSQAIAPNIYLMMYPKPALGHRLADDYPLQIQLWTALNELGMTEFDLRGKIYREAAGRLEPKELASVSAERIKALIPDLIPESTAQLMLFDRPGPE